MHPHHRIPGTFPKIVIFTFITLVALFVALLLAGLLNILLGGDPGNLVQAKFVQLISSVMIFIVPPLVIAYMWYEQPIKAYRMDKMSGEKQVFAVILLFIIAGPFINMLSHINEQMVLPAFLAGFETLLREMEDQVAVVTRQFLEVESIGALLFNLLVIAAIPALGEELFFRGALQRIFSEKWGTHLTVWVVAIIFSLIHFQMYGFLPRMVLGAILGYLFVWGGSLWLPILGHFINNALVVILTYKMGYDAVEQSYEKLALTEVYGYGALSAVLTVVLLVFIYRNRETKEAIVAEETEM